MPAERSIPILPLGRYCLRFSHRQPLGLPRFSGSAWRGALGWALRRAVCVMGRTECAGCTLNGTCAYPYIFETRPPPDAAKMRRYRTVPHPFVLEVPPAGDAADFPEEISVGLTLFGRANRLLPYLVHALAQAGAHGIGRRRDVLGLECITQESVPGSGQWCAVGHCAADLNHELPQTPAVPGRPITATVSFHTPMRLKRNGRNVTPESFEPADLFGNLLRRLSMLTYFHTDTPLETDFVALTDLARGTRTVDRRLQWRDWTRYSSRQQTAMQMGGVTGECTIDLTELDALWPYLWLGQWTHAGKGTSMGLGRYEIGPSPLL